MTTEQWIFSDDYLANSPSRRHGIDDQKELAHLQMVANCIQDMGRELSLPLLCINTAVIYTQRFYVFHPLTVFEKFSLGASALFLAAKAEEHPRKVEDICKISRKLGIVEKNVSNEIFIKDVLFNEDILLQTLGFEVKVQHPHQHVLLLCEFFKASKHLARTSYILATYCLHLTKMCLANKPTIIACLCIHTAAKMLCVEVPAPSEGKAWFLYADDTVTLQLLDKLTLEFVTILKKCPDKFKNRTLTNLVKKLSLDSTFVPSLKSSSKPSSLSGSPQSGGESYADGITSTLQEELSLITSSLSCESETWKDCDAHLENNTVQKAVTECNLPLNGEEMPKKFISSTASISVLRKDLEIAKETVPPPASALMSSLVTKTDVISKTLNEVFAVSVSNVPSRSHITLGNVNQVSLLKKQFNQTKQPKTHDISSSVILKKDPHFVRQASVVKQPQFVPFGNGSDLNQAMIVPSSSQSFLKYFPIVSVDSESNPKQPIIVPIPSQSVQVNQKQFPIVSVASESNPNEHPNANRSVLRRSIVNHSPQSNAGMSLEKEGGMLILNKCPVAEKPFIVKTIVREITFPPSQPPTVCRQPRVILPRTFCPTRDAGVPLGKELALSQSALLGSAGSARSSRISSSDTKSIQKRDLPVFVQTSSKYPTNKPVELPIQRTMIPQLNEISQEIKNSHSKSTNSNVTNQPAIKISIPKDKIWGSSLSEFQQSKDIVKILKVTKGSTVPAAKRFKQN